MSNGPGRKIGEQVQSFKHDKNIVIRNRFLYTSTSGLYFTTELFEKILTKILKSNPRDTIINAT